MCTNLLYVWLSRVNDMLIQNPFQMFYLGPYIQMYISPFRCLWDTGDLKRKPTFICLCVHYPKTKFSQNSQFLFFREIGDIVIPSPKKYLHNETRTGLSTRYGWIKIFIFISFQIFYNTNIRSYHIYIIRIFIRIVFIDTNIFGSSFV